MRIVKNSLTSQKKLFDVSDIRLPHILFLLFWLLKPYYFRQSGTIQLSDAIFLAAFFVLLVEKDFWFKFEKFDSFLLGFLACVAFINSIYLAIYAKSSFLLHTLYYIFSLFLVITFRALIKSKRFMVLLMWVSYFNLFVQLFVFLIKKGRQYDAFRYMGTLNDPNQFSFMLFSTFLLICVLHHFIYKSSEQKHNGRLIVAYAASFFLVFKGGSVGMLLGFIVFSLVWFLRLIHNRNTPMFTFFRFITWLGLASLFLLILVMLFSGSHVTRSNTSGIYLFSRVVEKINKIVAGGQTAALVERGLDKLALYPQYLFFGAGEGFFERFTLASTYAGEVHSTLFGLLFYYGLIPMMMLGLWILYNVRNMSKALLPVYLALFAECLILANQRQPVCWMLLCLASLGSEGATKQPDRSDARSAMEENELACINISRDESRPRRLTARL